MKTALLEIRDKFRPDRIIIESSGSAFPATLAFQIRELERETGDFKLDAIITVIDAENFTGYEDTSVTAKMQAQYSDLILVTFGASRVTQNKWNLVSERQLDTVMDHLFTLNESTPKLRCDGKTGEGVDPSLIFGLDSKLWLDATAASGVDSQQQQHHSEVETATVRRGGRGRVPGHHHETCRADCTAEHHQHDHPVPSPSQVQKEDGKNTEKTSLTGQADVSLNKAKLETALAALPKESVYRVKGFVRLALLGEPAEVVRGEFGSASEDEKSEVFIVNWAFGRCGLVPYYVGERGGTEGAERAVHQAEIGASRSSSTITVPAAYQGADVLLTIMGEPGEVKRLWAKKLAEALDAVVE
ncbi:hypothetical protein FS837_001437 [Tulasnella sp. UAMH 9824]|nr:hypothetical protein FS837_001437 [Tulasnella sp. UAMH 9824]